MGILEHDLVPQHEILPAEEVEQLLADLNITEEQLPKMLSTDPAVKAIEAKAGDVLKVTRKSPTAGTTIYYRLVI